MSHHFPIDHHFMLINGKKEGRVAAGRGRKFLHLFPSSVSTRDF
jgi:hypothetical protein